VNLQGTTAMKLNQTAGTNDVLQAGGAIAYGGTLSLANLGGTLASGQSYKLFAGSTYSTGFTSILPAIPRAGLIWDTSSLNVNGTLKIAAGATPRPPIGISSSGSNVILSGATSLAGVTYYLLSSTNASTPLVNWHRLATNTFDNTGHFSITMPAGANSQTYFAIQVP
jgi:hypothetical protein